VEDIAAHIHLHNQERKQAKQTLGKFACLEMDLSGDLGPVMNGQIKPNTR
jgi:hypothetical protein